MMYADSWLCCGAVAAEIKRSTMKTVVDFKLALGLGVKKKFFTVSDWLIVFPNYKLINFSVFSLMLIVLISHSSFMFILFVLRK